MFSIIFYLLFLCFTLVYILVFGVVFLLTVLFDRKRTILHYMSKLWTKAYFDIVPHWKIRTQGLEKIDRDKAYVVIVNHRSMLDILLMYVLPLEFKWVSKKEVYRWPLFGWVLWMHGDIAIERGTAKAVRKMVRDGGKWLSMGVSVIIFPEGSRNKGEGLGRFKEGAFVMAKQAGVGILPCVSDGTGTAFKGWKLNFKNRFRLNVLDPVSPEEVQAAEPHELAVKLHALMAAEYENMK